jgi:hypothetical protein
MSFHHFPSEFVYWDKIENHEDIKKQLLPIILQKSKENANNPYEACNLNTSLIRDDKRAYEENKFLLSENVVKSVVFHNIQKMINKYTKLYNCNINIGPSIVSGCWWNVYDEGDFQEEHNHVAPSTSVENNVFYPSFSAIYILHDENEESSIIFRKDSPLPLKKPFEDYGFSTSNVKDIREGTIIIFPYSLKHLVKPCVKAGRVTIAYNISSTFD